MLYYFKDNDLIIYNKIDRTKTCFLLWFLIQCNSCIKCIKKMNEQYVKIFINFLIKKTNISILNINNNSQYLILMWLYNLENYKNFIHDKIFDIY